MIKKISILILLSSNIFAFNNPFDDRGMKQLFQNQKELQKKQIEQQREIFKLKNIIEEQNNKIDGLISLNEGLSMEVNNLKNQPKVKQIDNTELIKDLGKMIDEINSKYITKEEVIKLIKKKKIKKRNTKNLDKNSKKLYSKAVRLYYNKRYNEANIRFNELLKRKYKLSSTNFFLGEIKYYKKDYETALYFYKKSASLNDDATYMTLLLYHTAYSLEKTNQKEQAKIFYKNLSENYTDKYSNLAKKRLQDLNIK